MLKEFKEMVDALEVNSSTNAKKNIVKEHCMLNETNKRLLYVTLDDSKMFGITSKVCKKNPELERYSIDNLFDVLTALTNREYTGHDAIALVNGFISMNKEYEDLIFRILDRDLKCKTGTTLVNNVFPNYIPVFDVALAVDFKKQEKNVDFTTQSWGWTRKLDGLRCITIVKDGDVKFYSRKGKEFFTLDVLKEVIRNADIEDCVLDGEICIVNEKGDEDYKAISKLYKKKDFTIPNPKYKVFDVLTVEEFYARYSDAPILDRMERCADLTAIDCEYIDFLPQNPITCQQDFEDAVAMGSDNGWEGIMIRDLSSPYKGKRTNSLLKVKKFSDSEYVVESLEFDMQQYDKHIAEDGTEYLDKRDVPKGTKVKTVHAEDEILKRANIIHKGNKVGVGSGWSLKQRFYYMEHPQELIGNQITVQYFELTVDKDGKESLRFPTVKIVHDGKRDN